MPRARERLEPYRGAAFFPDIVALDEPGVGSLGPQIRRGTQGVVRETRWVRRRLARIFVYSLQRWQVWLTDALACCLLMLAFGAVDGSLLREWRERGAAGAATAAALAGVVLTRLALDRRAPRIGHLLLLFCVVYGGAPRDLIPESLGIVGRMDDAGLAALSVRCFVRLCPDELVQATARRAERQWRSAALRRRLTQAARSPE